jgi:hypothetical protein
MKKNFKENYAKFVFKNVLGIENDSEKCEQMWKEIDSFYDTVCNGDFIEKFIFVSIFFAVPESCAMCSQIDSLIRLYLQQILS